MRVLCIDNGPKPHLQMQHLLLLLKEGRVYTVSDDLGRGYNLVEAPHPFYPIGAWCKSRFIPLQSGTEPEIEETTKELETCTTNG